MRVVPLTVYQKTTINAVLPLLVRLRLPGEEEGYSRSGGIRVWQNAHGEVRIEWDERTGQNMLRWAVEVSPAGTTRWRNRPKREERWIGKRELLPAEYMPVNEGI